MEEKKKKFWPALFASVILVAASMLLLATLLKRAVIPVVENDPFALKPTEATETEDPEEEERLRKEQEAAIAAALAAEEKKTAEDLLVKASVNVKDDIRSAYKKDKYTKKKIISGLNAYLDSKDKLKMVRVSSDLTGGYDQTFYYSDDKLVYIYFDGEDAYAFYLSEGDLVRVRHWSDAEDSASETQYYDDTRFEKWQTDTVAAGEHYLTTVYAEMQLSKLESSAKKQEKKDIEKADKNSEIKIITREESIKNAPKSTTKTTDKKTTDKKTTDSKTTQTAAVEILPESSTRKYEKKEIKKLTKDQLQLAINEIYARNGYKFKSDELNTYFKQFSWYKGTTTDLSKVEKKLNEFEKANLSLISNYQKEKGYR